MRPPKLLQPSPTAETFNDPIIRVSMEPPPFAPQTWGRKPRGARRNSPVHVRAVLSQDAVMNRAFLLSILALTACGPASSGPAYPLPYYAFTAVDSDCTKGIVIDGLAEVWTENTCVTPGFKKTSYVNGTVQTQLATDFGKLPTPANSTCPGNNTGGSATGSAYLLNDGVNSSKVSLQWVTTNSTQTWVACQANGQFVEPYDAVVVELTGQQ